jgi:DNA-directed RNA polymerase beta subunit
MSTPDGEKCGFVKNLAVSALVSSVMKEPLLDLFVSCGMKKLDEGLVQELGGKDKIFLNGNLIGLCAYPGEFVMHLRNMRRSKQIDPQVCRLSISLSFLTVQYSPLSMFVSYFTFSCLLVFVPDPFDLSCH